MRQAQHHRRLQFGKSPSSQTTYLVAGLLVVLLEVLGVDFEFDAPALAFLWCFFTGVVDDEFVEAAGALELCAISAAPEIISVIMSFFMVFSLEANPRPPHLLDVALCDSRS